MKDKNTTDLARRQLVKLGAMLTAAEIVQLRQPVYGRPEAATTVGERLWLWSHVAGSYNDQYNLPGKSRITPAEAAYYMSIPNIFGSSGFLVDVRSTPAPLCSFCGTGIDHCALA